MLQHQLIFPRGEVLHAFGVQLALTAVMCAPSLRHANPPHYNSRPIWQDGALRGGDYDGSTRANATMLAMASAEPTLPCLMV